MDPLLPDIPSQVATERLSLRSYRMGDGPVYFQAMQSNRGHLHEFLPPEVLEWQSETDAEIRIRHLMTEWQMRRLFVFGVWDKQNGAYVGEIYLANADWQVPCVELGYFLLAGSTGRGFATEAALATIRFAFENLKVVRVDLKCAADNQASIDVAVRCGFRQEGCLRQRHYKRDGTTVDRLWYGLLLSEWEAGRAGE